MSKKSLAILLLLPFILSILFFVTSSFLFTKIEGDITNIVWKYKNQEAFPLTSKKIKLEATPVLANNQEDVNATLIWSVKNVKEDEENHAEIEVIEGDSYLVIISPGEVIITCKNTSGNISKSFKAKLFSGSTITINTARLRSYQSIEGHDYYGMYDFIDNQEIKASFDLEVEIQSDGDLETALDSYQILTSSNIEYNSQTGKVIINGPGQSYIKYVQLYDESNYESYDFTVVDQGYNVYTYEDLMRCTNDSEEGKIVCLQTNMESLKNTYALDEAGNVKVDNNNKPIPLREDTVLFGNYDLSKKKFDFKDDVYYFTSTYNTEYIDQYNDKKDSHLAPMSKELIAGVHIQKDFYGNGFMINAHNLTYPTGEINVGDKLVTLTGDDLFRGPLPFVIIGNSEAPIVKAYGQDNVGFYVDGDNIVLNDVFFKNCDFSNILQNNDTTGTVMDVNGDNIVIKNSYLSSGRTVLRAFSTNNLLVKNSLLEKGREFIAKIGTNEYEKINQNELLSFSFMGNDYEMTREQFVTTGIDDLNLNNISLQLLMCGMDSSVPSFDTLLPLANVVQEALNPVSVIQDENGEMIYKGDVTFEDTYFYQSGIFSIGIDSQFNGPYLYDGSPVRGILDSLMQGIIYPDNIGGVSYPTRTHLKGDTRFYDYKTIEETDANCLVYQDISSLIGEPIDLDSFFPIKKLFLAEAKNKGYNHVNDDKDYLSACVAKYGGGNNYSVVDKSELNNAEELMDDISLNTFESSMRSSPASSELPDLFAFMIGRCVSMAMGFAPFNVLMYNGHQNQDAYLFGEQISLDNLRNRA